MVYLAALEMLCTAKPYRGFESHPLRQFKFESGETWMSRRAALLFVLTMTLVLSLVAVASAQRGRGARSRRAIICGDPTARCPISYQGFQPYDLKFDLPETAGIYETQAFYAVILKSLDDPNCSASFSEEERMAAQRLFPHRKVFASRCGDTGEVYYTNIAKNHQVMAVYAGETIAEARRVLAEVNATGKFLGANIRRMRAAFNGT